MSKLTDALVNSFAAALKAKLERAEDKYGYGDDWMADDWADDCRIRLGQHIEKGDPLDVAAFCAFMWYHDWSTSTEKSPREIARAAITALGMRVSE